MARSRDGVRCVRGSGLSIEDARELRVRVRDGLLWVHRPRRPPEVVGAAGSLDSALWLTPA